MILWDWETVLPSHAGKLSSLRNWGSLHTRIHFKLYNNPFVSWATLLRWLSYLCRLSLSCSLSLFPFSLLSISFISLRNATFYAAAEQQSVFALCTRSLPATRLAGNPRPLAPAHCHDAFRLTPTTTKTNRNNNEHFVCCTHNFYSCHSVAPSHPHTLLTPQCPLASLEQAAVR